MLNRSMEWILDESKWLAVSMGLAFLVALAAGIRQRQSNLTQRVRWLRLMSLFFASVIGTMGFGHLLAVTIRWWQETLEGSFAGLLLLGAALVTPSFLLIVHAARVPGDELPWRRKNWILNACTGVALIAMGPHNLPIALPAALNIAYEFHSRRPVGWTIVTVAVAAQLALFIGAVVFFASGQSFEQFKGIH